MKAYCTLSSNTHNRQCNNFLGKIRFLFINNQLQQRTHETEEYMRLYNNTRCILFEYW